MIKAQEFIKHALKREYTFWTGVPCSILKPFINYVTESNSIDYIGAASEGEAVAIAAGAHLAGRKTVTICQNSGFGNMVNPLTSLNYPFRIPTLIIVTHRGEPGIKDEPQHELMGIIIKDLIDTLRIPWKLFPDQKENIAEVLDEAEDYMSSKGLPYALMMKKGTVAPYSLSEPVYERSRHPEASGSNMAETNEFTVEGKFVQPANERMLRYDAIRIIRNIIGPNSLLIGTTGKVGRELFALGHRANQLYIVGSMGCASGIGLGVSLCQDKRNVIILDGDGATLMKMGTIATIGHYRPKNLLHIILDNESHESTGGQATVSGTVDFANIARYSSYRMAFRCDTDSELERIVKMARDMDGPTLIHVKVAIGSDPGLLRPDITPVQAKQQFMEYTAR